MLGWRLRLLAVDNIFFCHVVKGCYVEVPPMPYNKPLRGHEWVQLDCILRPGHLGPEDQLIQHGQQDYSSNSIIIRKREMHKTGYIHSKISE